MGTRALGRRVVLCGAFVLVVGAPDLRPAVPEDPVSRARANLQIVSDREGLPQNSIEDIVLDQRGRLWVSTRNGAAVYDGRHWTRHVMPYAERSNWPRSLAVDSEGSLWFGMEVGGFHRLDRYDEWLTLDEQSGFAGGSVKKLLAPGAIGQALWAGASDGLWRYRDGRWEAYRPVDSLSLPIESLERDGTVLWVGTRGGGLVRLEEGEAVVYPHSPDLPGSEITALELEAGGGALWVGTDAGLVKRVGDQWLAAGWGGRLGADRIMAIESTLSETGDLTVSVGIEGGGVARFAGGSWSLIDVDAGLPSDFVLSLLEVPNFQGGSTLAIGTLNGLAFLTPGGWSHFDTASGLPDRSVVSLLETLEDGTSTYWFGTAGGGLSRLDADGWWVFDTTDGLAGDAAFVLLEVTDAGRRELWVGTDQGISRQRNGRWETIDENDGLPRGAVVALMSRLSEDGGLEVWAGLYGGGVVVLRNGEIERIGVASGHLPDDRVEALLATDGDAGRRRVWMATDRGLVVKEDDRWRTLTVADGLPNDLVRSLHVAPDRDGRRVLWVGTDRGVAWAHLEASELDFRQLSADERQQMPNETIYRIEHDGDGRIYLTTTEGVVRLDFDHERVGFDVRHFGVADGLPSSECNFGASMRDSRGRIWVGTARGAALIDPAAERQRDKPAPLMLRALVRGQTASPVAEGDKLAHTEDHLVFSFDTATIFHKTQARFRSELVGVDPRPTAWSASSRRELTNLDAGDYLFRAWARDAEGRESEPVELAFSIRPAPWLSSWALLLYALSAGVALYGYLSFRTRLLRRRNVELEVMVASRTKELAKANVELTRASLTDPLTGTHNRRFLSSFLPEEMAQIRRRYEDLPDPRRDGTDLGLDVTFYVLDIDRFKTINDKLGHAVGDDALRCLTARIKEVLRDQDTIVRWGGDEFLVIARGSSRLKAPGLADRIWRSVGSRPLSVGEGIELAVSVSIGFASYPFLLEDLNRYSWHEVVEIADRCLLACKRRGRNGWLGLTDGSSLDRDLLLERLHSDFGGLERSGQIEIASSKQGKGTPV